MMLYDFFKYFGGAAALFGSLGGFVLWQNEDEIVLGVAIIIFSIVAGLFFIGFGALLESVHKIQLHVTGEKTPEPVVQQPKISIPGVKD
ncbi:hypothetical protein HPL003_17630 [Paenibacillus terrae HPL-003]|uniref:Uncharacterized protein n=1 Tax=Paenibacillus terrae (strain HPL-003) TaxID=985665 RepID=G7W0U3_PAETH|nr:hypothetical protein [Paenibacillus terrae]AET60270.1 hypothetical protein HPL003_17630 [Paenibacillus terrae HPL-003]